MVTVELITRTQQYLITILSICNKNVFFLQCREQVLSGVYRVVNSRQGQVFEANQTSKTSAFVVKVYLPVSESFGFTSDLQSNTSGQAHAQCIFDHWKIVGDDPFDPTSKLGEKRCSYVSVSTRDKAICLSVCCYDQMAQSEDVGRL